MQTKVELLTVEGGRAVPGPIYPIERSSRVEYLASKPRNSIMDDPPDPDGGEVRTRLAYRFTFFKKDREGKPISGTYIKFLIPETLCDQDGLPTDLACRLVGQRVGWE